MSNDVKHPEQPVGLCGPSELRVPRVRIEEFSVPDNEVPFDIAASVPIGERISALRQDLVRKVVARSALVKDMGGRYDITKLVLRFLDGDNYGDDLRGSDLQTVATRNRGVAHASSQSRNVDLFFKCVPKVAPSTSAVQKLERLLEDAWLEDQEVCLKLIFHIGAARKGKSDRWNFYDAILWLWEKSPAAVLLNLQHVEPAVYWKALLEMLARICEGRHLALERDVVMHQAYAHERPRLLAQDAIAPPVDADAPGWKYLYVKGEWDERLGMRVACGEDVKIPPAGSDAWQIEAVDYEQNSGHRKRGNCGWQPRTRLQQAENAVRKYDSDPLYRALHLRIAGLFADQLAADERSMREGKRVSLAAKWAPLLDKSFDRRTLVAESIARMLFPPHLPIFKDLTEQHYSYRARLRYATLLNELKEHRKEPARLLNAGRCSEISYKAVPATCMRLCTPLFLRLDGDRFKEFLKVLQEKKRPKLNAGALNPHELMRTAVSGKSTAASIAELQWKGMIANVRKHSKLRSCIAVCDMGDEMMQGAAMDIPHRAQKGFGKFDDPPSARGPLSCLDIGISLSLVISEVADEPFANKIVTFEDNVHLLNLGTVPATLPARARTVHSTHDEAIRNLPKMRKRPDVLRKNFLSSHFIKVFELLLKMPEPPERVFIFSTMQFNAVSEGGRDPGVLRNAAGKKLTAFQAAAKLYQEAGKTLPEVVFWNLSGCTEGTPVVATQPGATLVSGFSAALVKDILAGGAVDPLGLLAHVVSQPLFAPLTLASTSNEAKSAVNEGLALEGRDARHPDKPIFKHRFEVGEEWEMVESIPVEAEVVEAAAPRRAPLLAIRAVKRMCAGGVDATEDALLALIGIRGQCIKEARAVLSVAVAARLKMKARVWVDVEYLEDRLGVLAVTIAARAPAGTLREELCQCLLPALDALWVRAVRDPAEAAERKRAYESGDWLEAKMQRHADRKRKAGSGRDGPHITNAWGEVPYNEQLALQSPKKGMLPGALPLEDVVPALLLGLEGEVRDVVITAASERKSWPNWPAPRFAWTPPARRPAPPPHEDWATEEKAHRLKMKIRYQGLVERRIQKEVSTYIAGVMEEHVMAEIDHEERLKSKSTPHGGVHGYAGPASRARKSKSRFINAAVRGGKHLGKAYLNPVDSDVEREDGGCSPSASPRGNDDAQKAKQQTRLGRKEDARKRTLERNHDRDAKHDCQI